MDEPLLLARDVLDKQIYDVNGERMGKVDSMVIVVRQHRPPRVEAIEMNAPALWSRVHPWLGQLARRVLAWLSPAAAQPTRVRFEHVVGTGIDVHVDVDVTKTRAHVVETWLKDHVIGRIPGGASRGSKE